LVRFRLDAIAMESSSGIPWLHRLQVHEFPVSSRVDYIICASKGMVGHVLAWSRPVLLARLGRL